MHPSRYIQILQAVVCTLAHTLGREVKSLTSATVTSDLFVGWLLEVPTPADPPEGWVKPFDLRVYVRAEHVSSHDDAHRIVFIQRGGSIETPDLVGGGLYVEIDPRTTHPELGTGSEYRANIARTRWINIDSEVWGLTEAATEQLLHDLIAAWDYTCHNAIRFREETWIDQQDGQSGYVKHGRKVLVGVTVGIPVFGSSNPLRSVEGLHVCDCGPDPNPPGP